MRTRLQFQVVLNDQQKRKQTLSFFYQYWAPHGKSYEGQNIIRQDVTDITTDWSNVVIS